VIEAHVWKNLSLVGVCIPNNKNWIDHAVRVSGMITAGSTKKLSNFFHMPVHRPRFAGHWTTSSSADRSLDKPPSNFVKGHEQTTWDIVWVSPQKHRSSESVRCYQ